uniref:Uncharacterized protein n=1 Tax=Lepeophtheirus salmonis TaxID=72036 RepID=A0A0K2U603_LEPSM
MTDTTLHPLEMNPKSVVEGIGIRAVRGPKVSKTVKNSLGMEKMGS